MAPPSRTRGVRIRHPAQRKADGPRAEAGKDLRESGAPVPLLQKFKFVSTRSCLFLCFSLTLVAAIIIILPLAVFLHVHPEATTVGGNSTPSLGTLFSRGPLSLSKATLSRAFDSVSASFLLGRTKLQEATVQALASRMRTKAAGLPPDLKIKLFRSSSDVPLASGAKILPSEAGEEAQQKPEVQAASRNSTEASVGHHLQNSSVPAAASTSPLSAPGNASLTTPVPPSQRAGVQPPVPVAALKPVNVAGDSRGKAKGDKPGKEAKQEKKEKGDKKGRHRKKDKKKDKRRGKDRKKQKEEKQPAAAKVEGTKPPAKQVGGKQPAPKQVDETRPAEKQADGKKPAPEQVGGKKPAVRKVEEKKPEGKQPEGKKPAEEKLAEKQVANSSSSPNPTPPVSPASLVQTSPNQTTFFQTPPMQTTPSQTRKLLESHQET